MRFTIDSTDCSVNRSEFETSGGQFAQLRATIVSNWWGGGVSEGTGFPPVISMYISAVTLRDVKMIHYESMLNKPVWTLLMVLNVIIMCDSRYTFKLMIKQKRSFIFYFCVQQRPIFLRHKQRFNTDTDIYFLHTMSSTINITFNSRCSGWRITMVRYVHTQCRYLQMEHLEFKLK